MKKSNTVYSAQALSDRGFFGRRARGRAAGEAEASPNFFCIFQRCAAYDKRMSVHFKRIIPFLLLAALVLSVLIYPRGSPTEASQSIVVRIWNVDTFEGGKGSRASFLKRVAGRAEQEQNGVFYHVTVYTLHGIREAFAKGERPDILSFGVGIGSIDGMIPLGESFGGRDIAVPWCRGAYYLFSLSDNLPEQGAPDGRTVLSSGGTNLVEASAYFAGISGTTEESLTAYLSFLSGRYDFMLGTQRDICRFASRGVNFYSRLLPVYCDLYQYISILSEDKLDVCQAFVKLLLSEEVQNSLYEIGMYPAKGAQGRSVDFFSSAERLSEVRSMLRDGTAERQLDMLFPMIG